AKANLLRKNSKLDRAIESSEKNGLPPITVSPLQGQFLAIQCKLMGAKSVLEIGTLGGYGTIWFAQSGAKVTSIEIDPKHRDVALENVKGLNAEIILGAALDVLPKLAEEGREFDVVFIDAAWGEQWDYFDWAVKLTRPKGLIYVDNVVRALIDSGATDSTRESLVTKIGRDGRVTATLVPVVSYYEEGPEDTFDGFIMAVV
ncbi:O-methyltransferase, partial [Ilyonectria destructans]